MISKIKKFNTWLALKITDAVSSMWCAYVFTIIALISLPDAIRGGKAQLVAWIAQTFLQLVLLSVIMVGQDVSSTKSENRAEKDHSMLAEEFVDVRASLDELKELHAEMHEALEIIKKQTK